jgi:AGZA family xanthine/uracil permease-like MFS transporter
MVFFSGIVFFILTVTKIRQIIICNIPNCLMTGVGLGIFIALFDGISALAGLIDQSDLLREKTDPKQISNAPLTDSLATTAGALVGTSSTNPFLESAAGMEAGGRPGLTTITVGVMFLLAILFSPLARTIPNYAEEIGV